MHTFLPVAAIALLITVIDAINSAFYPLLDGKKISINLV